MKYYDMFRLSLCHKIAAPDPLRFPAINPRIFIQNVTKDLKGICFSVYIHTYIYASSRNTLCWFALTVYVSACQVSQKLFLQTVKSQERFNIADALKK